MNTYFRMAGRISNINYFKTWKVAKIIFGGEKKVRFSHQKKTKKKTIHGRLISSPENTFFPYPNDRHIPEADSQGGTQRWPAGLQLGQSLVLVPNFWQFGFGAEHAPRYPVRRLQFVADQWPGYSIWMWRGSGVSAGELRVSLRGVKSTR